MINRAQSGCEGRVGKSLLASKLLGLNEKVKKMTRVASCSWRTLAVFTRASLESYFMMKGTHAKINSLLVGTFKRKKDRKQSCRQRDRQPAR